MGGKAQRKPRRVLSAGCLFLLYAALLPFVLYAVALEVAAATSWPLRHALLSTAVGVLLLWILWRLLGLDAPGRTKRRLLGHTLRELSRLSGNEFEDWVAVVLRYGGWKVTPTPRTGDFGVDFIVERGRLRVGIEAKQRRGKVSNSVIRSVVGGCQYHGCEIAAVVTPSTFTEHAKRQAAGARIPVILIGGERLHRLATDLRTKARAARIKPRTRTSSPNQGPAQE